MRISHLHDMGCRIAGATVSIKNEAPAPRDGFADRMMAATAPGLRPASRDRRGGWKLARRVIIGTVAAGMVSAAAVASGLLGAAGIRVPVLTAMLAPEPVSMPAVACL